MLLKMFLNPFLKFYLKRKKNITVSGESKITYQLINNVNAGGSKRFPVQVVNSQLGNINFKEGCRFFDCVCQGKVTLGRFVTLAGPGVKVSGNVAGIEIDSFTSIGANVVIQEGEHDYRRLMTYFVNRNILKNKENEEITKGKIHIHEGVWIGSNAVILSGVEIGRGAVIGAGSVVTRNVRPYSIVVGTPAKEIKKRFTEDELKIVEATKWWEMTPDEIQENAQLFHGYGYLNEYEENIIEEN